jgi:hypothetical protein
MKTQIGEDTIDEDLIPFPPNPFKSFTDDQVVLADFWQNKHMVFDHPGKHITAVH